MEVMSAQCRMECCCSVCSMNRRCSAGVDREPPGACVGAAPGLDEGGNYILGW